jgi:hypothetical protein
MRRKPFSVVCLQRASPLRHQVKQSRRSSQRSRFLILMTVSLVEPWTYVLSKLSMPTVPPPSSETETWWDTPGDSRLKHNKEERKNSSPSSPIDHPNGVVPASADIDISVPQRGNPFDYSPLDSPLSASPSSSDEELFNHALALQTPMVPSKKPPPPPPPRARAGES